MMPMHTPTRWSGILALALALLATLATLAPAQERRFDPDPFAGEISGDLLAIHVEWLEVDAKLASRLLADYQGSGSVSARNLRNAAGKGGARVVETAYLVTRSGQRAKVESLIEWIYPTGGDPPEMPQKLTGPIAAGVEFQTPRGYTAFETRNVGTTLEVDPILGADGRTIDVNVAPEWVVLSAIKDVGRGKSIIELPDFATLKFATAVTLIDGDTVLLGVHVPMDKTHRKRDASKRIFVLLTASVLRAE